LFDIYFNFLPFYIKKFDSADISSINGSQGSYFCELAEGEVWDEEGEEEGVQTINKVPETIQKNSMPVLGKEEPTQDDQTTNALKSSMPLLEDPVEAGNEEEKGSMYAPPL
jgi:hypothetical protein